jgi:hypothetical protein
MQSSDSSPAPSEQDRRTLAKAIFRLFDMWELSSADQIGLLGLTPEPETLNTMRESGVLVASAALAERTRTLLRIYRYVAMLYPEHPELARKWMRTSHPRLDGETPMQRMLSRGEPGIRFVATILEEQLY